MKKLKNYENNPKLRKKSKIVKIYQKLSTKIKSYEKIKKKMEEVKTNSKFVLEIIDFTKK